MRIGDLLGRRRVALAHHLQLLVRLQAASRNEQKGLRISMSILLT